MGDYLREIFLEEEYNKNQTKYDDLFHNLQKFTEKYNLLTEEAITDVNVALLMFSYFNRSWFNENIEYRTGELIKLYFVYFITTTSDLKGIDIAQFRVFIKELPGAKKALRFSDEDISELLKQIPDVNFIKNNGEIVLGFNSIRSELQKLEDNYNINLVDFYHEGIKCISTSIREFNNKEFYIQDVLSINGASKKLLNEHGLLFQEIKSSFLHWNDFDEFNPVFTFLKDNKWSEIRSSSNILIKNNVALKVFYNPDEVVEFLLLSYPHLAKKENINLLVVVIPTNWDIPSLGNENKTKYEKLAKKILDGSYLDKNSVAIFQVSNDNDKEIDLSHSREVKVMKQTEEHLVDIAVVTALKEELEPLLKIKDISWTEEYDNTEVTTYYKGKFTKDGNDITIVAAHCPQMGMAAATLLSMNMVYKFKPKYLTMIGIVAGVNKDNISFGDILVAESSFDYGSGKIVKNTDGTKVFKPDFKKITIDSTLLGKLNRNHKIILEDIYESYNGPKPRQKPEKVFGPVASGAMVVAHEEVIKEIQEHERNLVGIDMETFGVYYSAHHCPEPRPKFFSIKAVCDFADVKKDDSFHNYAAFVSANYLYRYFLKEEL